MLHNTSSLQKLMPQFLLSWKFSVWCHLKKCLCQILVGGNSWCLVLGRLYSKHIAYNALSHFFSWVFFFYVSLSMNMVQTSWKAFHKFSSLKAFKVHNYIKKTLSVPRRMDILLKYISHKRWYIFSSDMSRNPQLIILIIVTQVSKVCSQCLPLCHLGGKKQTIHFLQDRKT